MEIPSSNVLYYDLEDDAWCCVRPSGTEPKIKCYVGAKGSSKEEAEGILEKGDIAILGGGTSNDHVSENYLSTQAMGAVIRI